MHILRIEHRAPNYEAWKQAFESDPVGRERGGVRRHRVSRQMDDPSYVMVDLEFETSGEAESFRAALLDLWSRVDVIRDPQIRVDELIESKEY
jgi:hypothetical protein